MISRNCASGSRCPGTSGSGLNWRTSAWSCAGCRFGWLAPRRRTAASASSQAAPEAAEAVTPDPAPAETSGAAPRADGPVVPRSAVDIALLARIEALARSELQRPGFSVESLAGRLAMSPRTLHRTLQRLTGRAPVNWLQELRLDIARGRLRAGESVSEAATAVGMDRNYFSRVYRAWFGHPPSQEETEQTRTASA